MIAAAPAPARPGNPARALRRVLTEACARLASGSSLAPWRALLLTGSVARGESRWQPLAPPGRTAHAAGPDGGERIQGSGGQRWRLCGDVDLVAISRDSSQLRAQLPALRQALTVAVAGAGLQAELSLSGGDVGYLARLPPSLFSLELQTAGEVLWGERKILNYIPRCTTERIPREDAWRLLNNRIVEFVAALAEGPGLAAALAGEKLDLDMAASWLLFTGSYALGAQTRLRRVELLRASGAAAWPWPKESRWLARLRRATVARVPAPAGHRASPDAELAAGCALEDLEECSVQTIASDGQALWRWELQQMGYSDLAHQAHSRPAGAGWAGWLAAARAAHGWAVRARCLRAAGSGWHVPSPRSRVYAAAHEWLRHYPELTVAARQAASRLPLAPPRGAGRDQVAAAIGVNYQTFVVPTRR